MLCIIEKHCSSVKEQELSKSNSDERKLVLVNHKEIRYWAMFVHVSIRTHVMKPLDIPHVISAISIELIVIEIIDEVIKDDFHSQVTINFI